MSILVIAEHDNAALKPATLNTVAAATALSDAGAGATTVLVAGSACAAAATAAAAIAGVATVQVVDDPSFAYPIAENLGALIAAQAAEFSHILAPATTFGVPAEQTHTPNTKNAAEAAGRGVKAAPFPPVASNKPAVPSRARESDRGPIRSKELNQPPTLFESRTRKVTPFEA